MNATKPNFEVIGAAANGAGFTKIHFDHASLGKLEVTIMEHLDGQGKPLISVYDYPPTHTVMGREIKNVPEDVVEAAKESFSRYWEIFMTKHPEHPKAAELREVIAHF